MSDKILKNDWQLLKAAFGTDFASYVGLNPHKNAQFLQNLKDFQRKQKDLYGYVVIYPSEKYWQEFIANSPIHCPKMHDVIIASNRSNGYSCSTHTISDRVIKKAERILFGTELTPTMHDAFTHYVLWDYANLGACVLKNVDNEDHNGFNDRLKFWKNHPAIPDIGDKMLIINGNLLKYFPNYHSSHYEVFYL